MITHVEIDGFTSFLDSRLDMPPFLTLVGPNSSGKSNLFDALGYDLDAMEGGPADWPGSRMATPRSEYIGQNIDLAVLAQVPA
jgi:ABC-type cobalamin/Fe3+-siderophores transport system ATPase subunit